MQFKEGTVNALVGPSGSGKSTIAKLVAALWDVDEGSISIGGVNIKDMPMDFYNEKVAYVSQDNYLFDIPIMENIRMGKAGASDEEVIAAAKNSGCHEFIMALEKGYDTPLSRAFDPNGIELSVGQKQRVALARAYFKDAPIIVLDEPSASIDPEAEAEILKAVNEMRGTRNIWLISHRLSTCVISDRILLFKDGQLIGNGSHDELINSNSEYKRMFQLQADRYEVS